MQDTAFGPTIACRSTSQVLTMRNALKRNGSYARGEGVRDQDS
jgi:hypothetical protein